MLRRHLAALADKLGSTLTDIDLSVKSPQTPPGAVEQDYGEKAEYAVDYEDIDEQYEGPEIQAASEEDYLLPKRDFFSAGVSLTTLKPTTSLFDDDDYDEPEEFEKEDEVVDKEIEVSTVSLKIFCIDFYIQIVTMSHIYTRGVTLLSLQLGLQLRL